MESKFDLSSVFRTSWRAAMSQIWVLAGLLIGIIILSMVISLLLSPIGGDGIGIFIVNVISIVIGFIFNLGFLKNIFETVDGDEPQFSAYGSQSRKLLQYIIAYILFSLIVLIGLCVFIIPGIYLAIRLQFFSAAIVDENCGGVEALKRSWSITKGQEVPLLMLFLTQFALILLGIFLLGIGVLVAYPVAECMYATVFRKLSIGRSDEELIDTL
jgi:uncharacterized membrane protein